MVTLILASASPRRHALVPLLGLPWEVRAAAVDEDRIQDDDPALNVAKTAALKAETVAALVTEPDVIVVGADTAVVVDGQQLGKPADADEAVAMLRRLRGREHLVLTGLALIPVATRQLYTDVAIVPVPMRPYSEAEIAAYVASGDPLDKAGAYAIQHPTFRPVDQLNDCFATVVGFPLCHLARGLYQLGALPAGRGRRVASDCQSFHDYHCPVFQEILAQVPAQPYPSERGELL